MGILSSIEEYTMQKFAWAAETTFGLNPYSSKLITSALNPFRLSGIMNWGALLLKNAAIPALDTRTQAAIREITMASTDALKKNDPQDFRSKVFYFVGYSIAKFGWDIMREKASSSLDNTVEKHVSDQLLSNVLEKDQGAINLFLHEIILKTPQEKSLLKSSISIHIGIIARKIIDIVIGAPIAAFKLALAGKTILATSEIIAPYLGFPLNSPYGILLTIVGLSIGRVAISNLASRLIATTDTTRASARFQADTLIQYAVNNPVKLISQDTSKSIFEKIKEQHAVSQSSVKIYPTMNDLYKKISATYGVFQTSFLHLNIGYTIFLGAELTYKNTLGIIVESIATINQQLNFFMSLTTLSNSITSLNKLTQAIADAEDMHKEALTHIEINNEVIFKISASEEAPLNLGRDGKLLFTIESELTVEKGDVLLIDGESGCGKSTLGTAIATGAFVEQGKIVRTSSFYKSMQAYQSMLNLTLIQDIMGKEVVTEEERKQVVDLFNKLGMQKEIENLDETKVFSGGQQQKISLIAALMSKKELIMLDEPFGPLDSASKQKAMTVIKDYASKGRTFIIIDHPDQNDHKRAMDNGGHLYNKVCAIKDEVCALQIDVAVRSKGQWKIPSKFLQNNVPQSELAARNA